MRVGRKGKREKGDKNSMIKRVRERTCCDKEQGRRRGRGDNEGELMQRRRGRRVGWIGR